MYYIKIGVLGSGFTNQLFSFITGLLIAYYRGEKIIIVDNFLNDFEKNNLSPISQILDINKINNYLMNKYNMYIIDKNNIDFKLNYIKYGTKNIFYDLTDHFINDTNVIIDTSIDFNRIKGDPLPNIKKQLFINYKINGNEIEEIYEEYRQDDIIISFKDNTFKHTFGWINSINVDIFNDILLNIYYHDNLENISNNILNQINNNTPINVIHLRVENDAIQHWSKMNNLTEKNFKTYIENKYINLIEKYLNKDEKTIILSASQSNYVIEFLNENNYNYSFCDKYFKDREKNAIIDYLVSKKCNNIFIGNFNFNNLNGSSFSYYIAKSLGKNINKIMIDMDNVFENEIIIQ